MASEIEITNAFEEIASPSASEIEITNTCKKIAPPSTCEIEITNPIKEIGPSSTSEIEITNDSEEIALPSASNIEIINAFEEIAMPSAPEIEKLNAFEKIALPSASNIEISSAFEEIAPSSASNSATSSTPLQKLPWDVFINHRGPDVKHTLAIRIYNVLHGMGLRVFLDSEELQLGDFLPTTLEETMRNASLHLAIFSPGYAYSSWCLAELSFMFKTGAPIIPVFYHVQPTDLQLLAEGKGIYANDFLQHQEKGRYSLKKLEECKKILYNVSFYEGENINNNDEEQTVLKNIVNRVQKVMEIVPLEVAKYPVGLEEAVEDFEMIVSESVKSHSNIQIVGIWGMGGSGKTTLAKKIYNKKRFSVEYSSFVSDVRDAATNKLLHKKQIKLLEDLGFKGEPFNDTEQGKKILSNHLRSVHVLIILDDINHPDQLDALLPTKDSLGCGSLIIITTREREVLFYWGISSIYKMKRLNPTHAKQLFCWHAFLQPSPLVKFEELAEKFLSVCNGLPLSLKVLGAQLYCYSNKDLWEDILHKVSKILPDDIKKSIRVSYNALNEEEKQIFLDIACFFIGKDNSTAIAVWEGSGWSGMKGLEGLVNKSLVELEDNIRIIMHDHLRDFGREIANTQSPYRLWSPDQITDIEKLEEDRIQIRGLVFNAGSDDVHNFPGFLLNTSTQLYGFRRTRRSFPLGLKVFVVRGNNSRNLHIAKLSRELALLSCNDIAHKIIPSWLPLKNLRALELCDSKKLVGLWNDRAEPPVQLRELIILKCPKLRRIPKSIGYLKNLKKIDLYECNVKNLPEELCRLQSLERLELVQCKLSSLPSRFGHLRNLRHLNLTYSYQLTTLPASFKQLMLLEHLNLMGCRKIALESDILENMTRLEYLNFSGCLLLKELPRHITNQVSLREFYLYGVRELPINIGQLRKLRVIEMNCFQMQSLPDSMGCLNLLERLVSENLEVESLPIPFKQLINLQILKILKCPIRELDFGQGPSTSSLCNLKEIDLYNTRVSKISISEDFVPGLVTLKLSDNDHLLEVDTLPTTVEDIEVKSCKLLRNISGIGAVVNLQTLRISCCQELDGLPNFAKLTSLKVFEFEDGIKVDNIQGLAYCTSLENLRISCCSELNEFQCFSKLASLKVLTLEGRDKVERVEGLQHCTSLERLVVDCTCWDVSGIECLEHLQRFRTLQLISQKRTDSEPCIQTIQKWPEETIICTKAVPGAGSLLNSSAFSNLSVLGSIAKKKISNTNLTLRAKRSSSGNAIMLCLVINCVSRMLFITEVAPFDNISITDVGEGKWIWMGVFTHPRCITAQNYYLRQMWIESHRKPNKVEKGFLVMGAENSLRKVFPDLLALLGN